MEPILIARDAVAKFYKRYEIFILPILRFLLGYYIFTLIGQIGHTADVLEFITDSGMQTSYAMLMGILFAILPISMGYFLIALNIIAQFSASAEVAVLVAAVLLLILFFYGRLGGMERWVLIFMIMGFYFGVPYIVPIIAGLYFGIQSIVPITLGVFLWEFYPLTFDLMGVERPQAETILEIPDSFGQVFAYGVEVLSANDRWIAVAFVYALVTLIVFAASKMDVDFSKEIAILLGVVINIVSFIFLSLFIGMDVNIFSVIMLSILSGFVALFIKMFDVILNYQRAERVEFEDDDNYYFVKVVPKMTIARRQRKVKQIKSAPEATTKTRGSGARQKTYDTAQHEPIYDDYDEDDYEEDDFQEYNEQEYDDYDEDYDNEHYEDDEHDNNHRDK